MAVRREKVILEVEDNATNPLLRSAAAAKTLDKALNDIDGSSVRGSRGMDRISTSAVKADRDINKLTGRLRLFADLAAVFGPGMVPIGAMAIPAIAGLAAQFGAAALAGGTMLIAFQGVGDALETVNKAALEPTAENLQAARDAMEKLSPAARQFVAEMQAMRPVFDGLRDAAGEGLFPGLTSALQQFDEVAPRVENVLSAIGEATGDIVNDFAGGLTGSRGIEFLTFLKTEVPDALRELGETMGNFTAGLAEMWMAFTPLNRDFSGWLLDASASFDQWAQGLSQTEGFENFVAYIRENGPKVADALGAIGNALVNIVTAAAPLGGPVLQGIEAVADLIATIAGSDAGPAIMAAVGAMTLLSRGTQAFGKVSSSAWAQNLKGANGSIAALGGAKVAAQQTGAAMGLLALSMTDVDEKAGVSNLAMGALVGTMIAPGVGTGIGALVGGLMDLAAVNDDLAAAIDRANSAINASDYDAMKASLAEVGEETGRQSMFISGLTGVFPELGRGYDVLFGNVDEGVETQKALNVAMAATEGRTTGVAGATRQLALAAAATTVRLQRQAEALALSREAAGETAREFVNLGKGLDNAKVSLSGWIRQLQRQADALRNFRVNAQEAAEKGLRQGLIAALHEAGPAGALRMRQLANATDKEIARANQAWGRGQQEIRRYTDAIGGVPPEAKTKVVAETAAALNGIGSVAARLQALDGNSATVTTYMRTVQTGGGKYFKDVPAGADGMTVPGPRLPYRDKVLAYLAPGEEVVTNRNGEADRFRADRAAGRIPAYGNGGTAGWAGERHARGWASGGGARVLERVIERLPREFIVQSDLGPLVFKAVDQRMGDVSSSTRDRNGLNYTWES